MFSLVPPTGVYALLMFSPALKSLSVAAGRRSASVWCSYDWPLHLWASQACKSRGLRTDLIPKHTEDRSYIFKSCKLNIYNILQHTFLMLIIIFHSFLMLISYTCWHLSSNELRRWFKTRNSSSMHQTLMMHWTFSAQWQPLTRIPPHSWRAFWGCAHNPSGVTAAGPAAAWLYSQNPHCHSWSAVWTACYAWCGARVWGELVSLPCGQQDRSAAGQTTV